MSGFHVDSSVAAVADPLAPSVMAAHGSSGLVSGAALLHLCLKLPHLMMGLMS